MASITIRGLDDAVKAKLREQAACHGRSLEAEAREILKAGIDKAAPPRNLVDAIRRHIEPLGGIELELPPREFARQPPDFGE